MKNIMYAVDESNLQAYPVQRLKGKAYLGNSPEVVEPFSYEELEFNFD